MEDNYSPTARKVVSSYYQNHCAWYTEGKQVVAGKVLATFKDAEKWNGGSGMGGWRHKIETSAAMSAKVPKTWVGEKLPPNSKLAPLALEMIHQPWNGVTRSTSTLILSLSSSPRNTFRRKRRWFFSPRRSLSFTTIFTKVDSSAWSWC